MWQPLKEKIKIHWPLLALAGVSALSVGMVVALLETVGVLNLAPADSAIVESELAPEAPSAVLGLADRPPAQRTEALSLIAQQQDNQEGHRARYLLATDLLSQGRGGSALTVLDGLEQDYEALAPYVLLKRAQAQTAAGQPEAAQQTWQALAEQYAQHPAAAEALYTLGQSDESTWEQLIANFPAHPRSVEVAAKQLPVATGAKQMALLRLLVNYGLHQSEYGTWLDQFVSEYGSLLTPEDWQAAGFGYWETQRYGKAGSAYAKAPASPLSRYRAGRGAQLDGQRKAAIAAYRQLAQAFPDAPETATGLLKLADLLPQPEAIKVLDQVMARFPNQAATALGKRADRLDALQSPTSAQQARDAVLSQYSQSEAAAELRFRQAQQQAKAGHYESALSWAQQLLKDNSTHQLAPEVGFLAGKWALQLEQPEVAQRAFERVIGQHPESYFAWRSAVYLGWDVGDFDGVRSLDPQIVLPDQRTPPPAGSDTLKELYLLGQDQDAWTQWQNEFRDRESPSVAEQFTDGLMRIGVGDTLDGIFMVSNLAWREQPQARQEYLALQADPAYWQAMYPFPYEQLIETWSRQRQLNPLLVTALIRQESRFVADIESVAGALGLMQVMPGTADWIEAQIGQTGYDLTQPADNVELGTWYLDYTHREYDNNALFAVASYNAGPGNVADWIQRGGFTDADDFVRQIPFAETQGYVEAVFGGYWNYLRLYNPAIAAKVERLAATQPNS